MQPVFDYNKGNVRAYYPDCGAIATFDFRDPEREFGYILVRVSHSFNGQTFECVIYRLLRCSGCHRAGVAKIHQSSGPYAVLEDFYPTSIEKLPIPHNVPQGIANEFREAELCASVRALRAVLALFRSTLEKALEANGYTRGNLKDKIDEAARDHVITAPRQSRAQNNIRDLANEILHGPWREVTQEEVDSAHLYTQRILEDLYDDRKTVEAHLQSLGRLPSGEEATRV